VDSLFLYTDNDVLKIHIPVFHVPDWVANFYLDLRCMRWF
jgi:hypothetical protein